MTEIIPINALRADRENDNGLVSPREMLMDAIAAIDGGRQTPNKALTVLLDTGTAEGVYDFKFFASDMTASEMVALCEALKFRLLTMMRVAGVE